MLLRYACKKELDMHVYSQGAAADGEVAADDARAGSGGGGARARPSCTLSTSRSICARETAGAVLAMVGQSSARRGELQPTAKSPLMTHEQGLGGGARARPSCTLI